MTSGGLFSISDFAEFSRTTRDTLLYYDRLGLLSPVSRGENNYRFYSSRQLAVINVIRTLQQLGMSLDEIKNLKDQRTPKLTAELFMRQIEKIDSKIMDWERARKLLLTLQKSIHAVANIDEHAISIQYMPAEAIILGTQNDYRHGRTDYDALYTFYQVISEKYPYLDMNYPVWATFAEKRIKQGDWVWPDSYYLYHPDGRDRKPAALYAIGYTRGGYGQGGALYSRLTEYIDHNGFEICGNAYEEYPLNEVCISDDKNYLIRVMIIVREKKTRPE